MCGLSDKKQDVSKKKSKPPKGSSAKFRHSTLSMILTIVVVAAVVLANAATTMVFDRYPLTIDMTDKKIYTISDRSLEYVKKIATDVTVTVFSDEETYTSFNYPYNKQAMELLKNYSRENSRIKYRFVDIDKNPDIARSYNDVRPMDIVFETKSGEISRTRKVGVSDIINFQDRLVEGLSSSGYTVDSYAKNNLEGSQAAFVQYFSNYIQSSNAEQAFTSALLAVTDPKPVNVVFLTGRGELTEPEYMKTLLSANGYNVSSLDITSSDIPQDTDVAVICAPRTDYMQPETDKLEKFVSAKNKHILYFSHAAQGQTPLLSGLLKKYGVSVGQGIVCERDTDKYYNQPYYTLAQDISQTLKNQMDSSDPRLIVAQSRPVETPDTGSSEIEVQKLLQSSDAAFSAKTEELVNDNVVVIQNAKQCYAALGTNTVTGSGAAVIGTSSLVEDRFMAYGQYQNREFILALFSEMTNKTPGIKIEPKVLQGGAFEITQGQKQVLKWTFIVIIPVAVAVTGIVVTVRRKRR